MIYFERAQRRSEEELSRASELLSALAHPLRLRIVDGLMHGDCGVGDMVECLDLPQPMVSRHLAILREAGVLELEITGRHHRYSVADPLARRLVHRLLDGGSSSRAPRRRRNPSTDAASKQQTPRRSS